MTTGSPHPWSITRSGGPRRTRRIELAWIVVTVVLVGAFAVVVMGAVLAPDRRHDIWVELVSRAAQLIVLALAGGVVGAVIHDRDAAREDARRRQAFLLDFVGQVEAAYGMVKTARRIVRTYGFDAPRDTRITPEQAEGFRTQLAMLNEAELQFETLARKVVAVPGPFGATQAALSEELAGVHGYLNGVLREWQSDPTVVVPGGTSRALAGWPRFAAFVGYDEAAEHSFREGVSDRIIAIELLVHGLGATGA